MKRYVKAGTYKRKDSYILKDIVTVAKASSMSDLQDMLSMNPKFIFKDLTDLSDANKLEAIKRLIQNYNYFSAEDDKNEEYNAAAEDLWDKLSTYIASTYPDHEIEEGERYNTIEFSSDKNFTQVLDDIENQFDNIRTHGTGRGGSWTTIDYITDKHVEFSVGMRSRDGQYYAQVMLY